MPFFGGQLLSWALNIIKLIAIELHFGSLYLFSLRLPNAFLFRRVFVSKIFLRQGIIKR